MTNRKSTTKADSRRAAGKTGKSKISAQSAAGSPKGAARPETKHARIIAMLRAPAGATIAAIATATEWQPHSVRGFLAGVVRKRLGLSLSAEQTEKGRVYRIRDAKASSTERAKQVA